MESTVYDRFAIVILPSLSRIKKSLLQASAFYEHCTPAAMYCFLSDMNEGKITFEHMIKLDNYRRL